MTTVAYDHQIFCLQQFGGISRYFCELAARIGREPGWDTRVVAPLYCNDYLANDIAIPRIGLHLSMQQPRLARLYRAASSLVAPALLAALDADVLHRTYYGVASPRRRGRLVITVLDMIHELYPEHFQANDPTSHEKRRSVEAADQVICISHSTANDLIRLLGVPEHKISVTHLGFSDAFSEAAFPAVPGSPDSSARRPFLLYVGQRGGYKNFSRVLEAYGSSLRLQRNFDLVAFGGFPFTAAEQNRIKSLGLRPDAVRREAGSDAALARAYRDAHAFVYPSEYEGFGIPPLEAMSCGCPVACSNTSSVPEVVGEAGEYFAPDSVEQIRNALERLTDYESRRQALIAAGYQQCQRFSWDRCATETMAVYGAPTCT